MENEICHLKVEEIVPNKYQPREVWDESSLKELTKSIEQHGVIQPIIVRKLDDKYEIIDGERRYKASIMAGLTKMPAIVRSYNDNESVRIALIDNLQRQDFSPIEEARMYKRILENEGMTQEELANNIGKSQSAVANKLRLLNLPMEVQESLLNQEISERHARSLLTIKDTALQIELLKKIVEKRMTVRELDSEIKNMSNMFIPEEYSNNVNNEQGGMFVQNNNVNDNPPSTNQFINFDNSTPSNNFSDNGPLSSNNASIITQNNSFISSNTDLNNQNSFMPTDNNFNDFNGDNNMMNGVNNQQPNFDNNQSNVASNQSNLFIPPFNNNGNLGANNASGNNPFFTSNNYTPPMQTENNQPNTVNPFSSIRMNSSNRSNVNDSPSPFFTENNQNQEVNYSGQNEVSSEPSDESTFNIDDYKLPGVDYGDNNNNYVEETEDTPAPLPTEPVNNVNEYKYVEDNPNYVSVDNPCGVESLNDVINMLKVTLDKIKTGKIKVDTEEIDYDDSYLITIRVDKKGDF